jgi:ribosome-binding ATPase YchF (GTP1/OBG family)
MPGLGPDFVRAETASFEYMDSAGLLARGARTQRLLRLEGKEYIVQERGVILFRLKVCPKT